MRRNVTRQRAAPPHKTTPSEMNVDKYGARAAEWAPVLQKMEPVQQNMEPVQQHNALGDFLGALGCIRTWLCVRVCVSVCVCVCVCVRRRSMPA